MAKLSLTRMQGGYLTKTAVNNNYTLIEAAMDNTLSRDGSTPNTMNADIDMNSSGRILNLQDAVHGQEPVTLNQAAGIVSVTTVSLTQDNVAAVLWPQSTLETSNSVVATELQYYYGDVRRYGAKLDGTTDDTAAFNAAVASGYGGFCDNGTAAISGTIVVKASQYLRCNAGVTLQRFAGGSTAPILHLYGNYATFDGGGCIIRQNLYDHPNGIVLLGPDPDDASVGGSGTNVQCYFIRAANFAIKGPEGPSGPNAPINTGSPGLYIHSCARKKGTYVGYPTYRTRVDNIDIVNCDILLAFSSDANANCITHFYGHQWMQACIHFNASYGNMVYGFSFESALDDTTAERGVIVFGAQNSAVESDTDSTYLIDAAFRNTLHGYCEVPAPAGLKVIRVFLHTETGTLYGENEIHMTGSPGGGVSTGGSSADSAIGSNRYLGPGIWKFTRSSNYVYDIGGWQWRGLDDDSGVILTDNGWAECSGRGANIAEGTQYDILEVDEIGPNTAGMMFTIDYIAKASAVTTVQAGRVCFVMWQETAGSRDSRKLYEHQTSFDETAIVTPNITLAAATSGTTKSKATLGFLTTSPAGTNDFFIAWRVRAHGTELSYSTSDYDADFSIEP